MPTSEVLPGFLASLPTTQAVLAALRKAHGAKLAILGGTGTAAKHDVHLAIPHGRSACLLHAAFSACGQFLAITYDSRVTERINVHPLKAGTCVGGVVVHKTTCGLPLQTEVRDYDCTSAIHWAQAPHLSIAQLKEVIDQDDRVSVQQLAVQVLDVQAGSKLTAFSSELKRWEWAAISPFPACNQLQWSPSGRYLLASCQISDGTEANAGLLTVIDVWGNRLWASDFSTLTLGLGDLGVRWHPSSRGLVLGNNTVLHTPKAFAGVFALGQLPRHDRISDRPGMGFSADGQKFLAASYSPELGTVGCKVLRCMLVGQEITFQSATDLIRQDCCWLPCSTKLLARQLPRPGMGPSSSSKSFVMDVTHQAEDLPLKELRWSDTLPCFSASQLMMAASSTVTRIFSLESGKQLWAAEDSLYGAQQSEVMASYSISFLPSGCGIVCAGSLVHEHAAVFRIFTFA